MAEIHWAKPKSGDFNDPRRWVGKAVPGPGDDAILDASGKFYAVSVTQSAAVGSIQISVDSELTIDKGATFTATEGTGSGVIDDDVIVSPGADLVMGGGMDIESQIAVGGAISFLSTTTLSGDGVVSLRGATLNRAKSAAAGKTRLINLDDTIGGSGVIGGGKLTLINDRRGTVVGTDSTPLVIDTPGHAVVNAGLMGTTGPSGALSVVSDLVNNGKISANGGSVTIGGAVTGRGSASINSATLSFQSAFNQNVTFKDETGRLVLGRSQVFAATIRRFSGTGATSLDLVDIGFTDPSEAVFSGTPSGGVLTVSDGEHTASIHLQGDYQATNFTASSDGHGGTVVVGASHGGGVAPSAFISAMASLAAAPGHGIQTGEARPAAAPLLSGPRPDVA